MDVRHLAVGLGILTIRIALAEPPTLKPVRPPVFVDRSGAPAEIRRETADADHVDLPQRPRPRPATAAYLPPPGRALHCPGPYHHVSVDFSTGAQAYGATASRSAAIIYENTQPDGYYQPETIGMLFGDNPRMIDSGRLRGLSFSTVVGGYENGGLVSADVTVEFYDVEQNLVGAFMLPEFDFTCGGQWPSGLPPHTPLIVTVTGLESLEIHLPQIVYIGECYTNVVTAKPIWGIGWLSCYPPAVGATNILFWWVTSTYGWEWYYACGEPVNHYLVVEADRDHPQPDGNPVYANTTQPDGQILEYETADDAWGDDLSLIRSGVLDRVEFSIYNPGPDAAETVDLDVQLWDWHPLSSSYRPSREITVIGASLGGLPPGQGGSYYIDGLASQGITVPQEVAVTLRFSNIQPPTIPHLGQVSYHPPTIGGSDYTYERAIGTNLWAYWSGDVPPVGNLYWRIDLAPPLPCNSPGDLNCDGWVNNQDIEGFIDALFGLAAEYDTYLDSFPEYHPCDTLCADFTGDRLVNSQDIDGFVEALFGG